MADSFLGVLSTLFKARRSGNNSETTECVGKINHYLFYQISLTPAFVICLLFALTKSRRNLLLSILGGRPGLVFPMDTLTRSSRISYACAFGATSFLVYQIVISGTLAIDYQGYKAVVSFLAIVSVLIYGIVFLPVFACLAMGSVFGYTLGALYVWMLTAVEIYKLTECQLMAKARALLVLRALPNLLCLLYLSVSIPARMHLSFSKGLFLKWKDSTEPFSNSLDNIRNHSSGRYVSKLFRKPKTKNQHRPVQGKGAAVKAFVLGLVRRFIYHNKKGFRYPARILSVMVVGMMVIYRIAFEFLVIAPSQLDMCVDGVLEELNEDGPVDERLHDLVCRALDVLKSCVIVGITLAALLSLLNVLHMLSSYRSNLLALYKGDHSHIPAASTGSNTSHCINSIKFGGFQVGYMIWAFILQCVVLSLVCIILAGIVILFTGNVGEWLVAILEFLWPVIVTIVVLTITQILLARFVFLQERGAHLALDNRSVFFNFTYFMFFYNIFMGLLSCFLRIIKAVIVGIFFLGRLDTSTMCRKFEFFDPGFTAYVGYMQMEYAHSHPVVVVFIRLVVCQWNEARHARVHSSKLSVADSENHFAEKLGDVEAPTDDRCEASRRRSMKARFNWHVTYTLLHNPELRVMRKGFMQMLRQAHELGVHVPISDNQASIDTDALAEQIQRAREELKTSGVRRKTEEETESVNTCEEGVLLNKQSKDTRV